MSFIYNKSTGVNDARIGKLETPIKMIIEHESDLLKKNNQLVSNLFNVETSNRFGETIVGGNEFGVFMSAEEGGRAENDSVRDTYKKFIRHIQFMKEFTITAEMVEDAVSGVAAEARRNAEMFTRSYYNTRNQAAQFALSHAANGLTNGTFARANFDLTAQDGKCLFATDHAVGVEGDKQSNKFAKAGIFADAEAFEEALSIMSVKYRNMKDENGDPMGYVADTLLVQGDNPVVERVVRKVCGTEQANGGSTSNYINTQYGNWNVVVLPSWMKGATGSNQIIVMSKEANKNLAGNMFFDRIPLTITPWIDYHTGNYVWNGRCRFGIGFGNYKHIALLTDDVTNSGATVIS